MTRYAPLWQQANGYSAWLDRQLVGTLWPGGGTLMNAAAAPVTNTMNVSVPPGTCVVPLTPPNGSALCVWDTAEVVTLAAAPSSGNNRWDLIICQVRDNAVDGGPNNDFIITNVTGVAASGFTGAIPAAPANSFVIANIFVLGAAANLNGAAVTDRRMSVGPSQTMPFTPTLVVYSSGTALVLGTGSTAKGAYRMLGPTLMQFSVDLSFGTSPDGKNGPICLAPPPGFYFTSDTGAAQPFQYVTAQLNSAAWGAAYNCVAALLPGTGGMPGPNTFALSLMASIFNTDNRVQRIQNTDGTLNYTAGIPKPNDTSYWIRSGAYMQIAGIVAVQRTP